MWYYNLLPLVHPFFHLSQNKLRTLLLLEFNLSTKLYIRDKRLQSVILTIQNTISTLFTCTTIQELESRTEKIFFVPRCVTTSKLSVSRSCDSVANRRCSNSTIQWLWVSNSVSGRGRGRGYQYWYSTSRSSPLLKSLDPVIDDIVSNNP